MNASGVPGRQWPYVASGQGDAQPVVVHRGGWCPRVLLPDGTELECETLDGARAVAAVLRIFVRKQIGVGS